MGNEPCQSVHALRSRWKPTKERLQAARRDHPTSVRLHRAFSWMQRCEQAAAASPTDRPPAAASPTADAPSATGVEAKPPGHDADIVLVCQWIALNALYGRWDAQRREPVPDRECWRAFLERLVKIDASGHLSTMLTRQRDLVMSILEDEYLSAYFWEEPGQVRASKSRKARFDARTWYIDGKWGLILERVVERIYLLRCQLVHGAATFNGKLNRQSLALCVTMLRHLLNAAALVMIDHGADEDWGDMCYPPLTDSAAPDRPS